MSRRRQVLQLESSSSKSKLRQYGYSKGFQTKEVSEEQGQSLKLIGDYSDTDSDSKEDESGNQPRLENHVQVAVSSKHESQLAGNDEGDAMDDELRNFFSEIESIPVQEEAKVADSVNNAKHVPSPTSSQPLEDSGRVSNEAAPAEASSKKSNKAYSMFVKGDMEFAHSPNPSDVEEQSKELPKSATIAEEEQFDLPEEPTTQWQMVQDEATQYYYYWNWQTNEVTWDIPTDYTQYLLLHREYEERLAKLTPQQRQAVKDRAERNAIKEESVSNSVPSAVEDTSISNKEDGTTGQKSHSHHKKKKSKKHKRRHSSDEEDNISSKSKKKDLESEDSLSAKKKKDDDMFIGPQPLSIVPYLSDNEDEEEQEDGCTEEKDSDAKGKSETVVDNQLDVSLLSSSHQGLVSGVVKMDVGEVTASPDSVMSDLDQLLKESGLSQLSAESKNTAVESSDKNKAVSECDRRTHKSEEEEKNIEDVTEEGDLETKEENLKIEVAQETEVEKEKSSPIEINDSDSLQLNSSEKENATTEPLPKEKKKKKEVINMFADDTPPRLNEVDEEEIRIEKTIKSDTEEGEISDSSESTTKLASESREKIVPVKSELDLQQPAEDRDKDSHLGDDKSVSKNLVGYVEEDEEEGELKEDPLSATHEIGQKKDKTDERKRLLPRKQKKKDKVKEQDKCKDKNTETNREKKKKLLSEQADTSCERNVVALTETKEVIQDEKDTPQEEEKHPLDDTDDLDLDDLDDLDRALELAMEKNKDKKLESKPDTKSKEDINAESSSSETLDSRLESLPLSKKEEKESFKQAEKVCKNESRKENDVNSDGEEEKLKFVLKDSTELALSKLKFLDISTKSLSKLQVLLIELQTRFTDWQAGGLSAMYFQRQLGLAETLLSQYEENAVPAGWLCQWDRYGPPAFFVLTHIHCKRLTEKSVLAFPPLTGREFFLPSL